MVQIEKELVPLLCQGESGAEIVEGSLSVNGQVKCFLRITLVGTMEECYKYRTLLEKAMEAERGARVVYDFSKEGHS